MNDGRVLPSSFLIFLTLVINLNAFFLFIDSISISREKEEYEGIFFRLPIPKVWIICLFSTNEHIKFEKKIARE